MTHETQVEINVQIQEGTVTEMSDCEIFWETHLPRILAESRDTRIASLNTEAVFQIDGPGGGEWSLTVKRGVIEALGRGALRSPTVTIRLSEEVFLGIARGDVDHKTLFFKGRIGIRGDIPLVLWISNLIPVLREAFPFDPQRLKEELA